MAREVLHVPPGDRSVIWASQCYGHRPSIIEIEFMLGKFHLRVQHTKKRLNVYVSQKLRRVREKQFCREPGTC